MLRYTGEDFGTGAVALHLEIVRRAIARALKSLFFNKLLIRSE